MNSWTENARIRYWEFQLLTQIKQDMHLKIQTNSTLIRTLCSRAYFCNMHFVAMLTIVVLYLSILLVRCDIRELGETEEIAFG